MYLYFSNEQNCFYVQQFFGYALQHVAIKTVSSLKIEPAKTNNETISDPADIYKFLLEIMIFSEHYIEDSLFYKKYIDLLHNNNEKVEFDKDGLSREELREYYKKHEEEFDREAFLILQNDLKNAKITSVEKLYVLPYLLEGKQFGFRVIEKTLYIYENGKEVKYNLPTKKLSCIISNEEFVHIEPSLGMIQEKLGITLDSPRIQREIVKSESDEKKHLGLIFAEGYEQTFQDAIEIGLIQKL